MKRAEIENLYVSMIVEGIAVLAFMLAVAVWAGIAGHAI